MARPVTMSMTCARRPVALLAGLCLALGAVRALAGVNAWTTNGPSQTVNAVAIDPTRAGRLYAASADGVYRSDNDGATWERLGDSLPGHNVLSAAVDPADGNRLYAGTNLGFFLSTSAGSSWTRASAPGAGIMALAIGPASAAGRPSVVYAGTFGRGVFVSEDGGSTWRRSDDLIDAILFALQAAPLDAATVYAGTARGLYVSRDRGLRWTALGESLRGTSVRAVQLSGADPNRIVVGTFGAGVLRSVDGGTTWSAAGAGLPSQVRSLAVDEANPDVIYAATSTGGFYRTKDGGASWLAANFGLADLTSRFALLDPRQRNRLFGAGAGQGVWEIRFAPEPQVEVSPAALDFGAVPVSTAASRVLRIANTGTADLVVSSVRLGGSSGFAVDFGGAFVVAPGGSRPLNVTFAPVVRDLILRDEVRVSSSDPDQNELAVPVSGRGTRSLLSASPSRLDFGPVRIPPGHADTAIALTNTGSAPLQLFGAAFDNGRFAVQSFTPVTLQPGRSTRVRVAFNPLVPGPQSGNLRVVSDSVPDTLRIPVTGSGTAPDIIASAAVLDYGRVDLGQERTLSLVVTNTGTAPLTISRLAPRGGQFWVDRTLGVPRDTSFVVPAADTIRVLAGGDTTVTLADGAATTVSVGRDTTRLISGGDTTVVVTGAETTVVVVGRQRTVFRATQDSTVLAPDSSFTFRVTYRPSASGAARDTLDILSDAPLRLGLLQVVLRGEGNALSLEPATPIPLGLRPVDLVAAALDDVAGVDLAVVDSASGRLHVLLNDGAGEFPVDGRTVYPNSASAYGRWAQPVAVAAAHLFGTASVDLVVGDRVGRSISVLANDGRGHFAGRRSDIFVGYQLADVFAGDLDADGDADIAVANGSGANSITLLYNDGQGGFSARAVVRVQAGPVALAAGNVNADGHVDLVVANRFANSVSVLLNDRKGSFAVAGHYAVGVSPLDVTLADYDADGDADVAVAANGSRGMSLLRNDGSGALSGVTAPQSTSLGPVALAAGGMTADVLNDLVTGGDGDFVVFFENRDGASFRRQDIDTGFPVRDLLLVDLDDNRVSDLLVLSSDSARVQLFRNRLLGRNVPPRPPARVAAADVTRDLGGRILLTWEDGDYGTQRPQDQVIATTAYTVVRATGADFADPDTLAVVPGGTLSWVDDSATPYEAFYYRMTSSRGSLVSAPSEPTSAASLPAPLFDLKLANAPRISRGDTLRVQLFLTPAQHRVAGLSLFLTYEPASLQLMPAPGDSTQPFRVSPDVLGSFAPAVNASHDGVAGSGKLDLTLVSTAPGAPTALSAGVEPVLLGEVWFVASRQATTFLTLDDEPGTNRRTAVVEDSTGLWIEPVLGDTTRLAVRDVFVSGQLHLERRAAAAVAGDQATVLFIGALGDTLASPLNDEDRLAPGIQVSLDGSGRFALDQIPAGTYRVFAKVATHLQGSVQADTATVDSSRRNLAFRWVAPDTTSVDSLPGGDANNDNRVNLADFGLVVRHFGATPASPTWSAARRVDFDGDGLVGIDDFLMLADNFGRVGMDVVRASRRPLPMTGEVYLDDGGGLRGRGLGAIRGLSLRLPPGARVRTDGSVFSGREFRIFEWPAADALRVALALSGAVPVDGDGLLLTLEGAVDSERALDEVEVLDARGVVFRPAAAAAPRSSALFPNYPNPFNPSTTIPFDVAGPGDRVTVRLEIFDVLGQRVRVLVEDDMRPGRYRAEWDSRDDLGTPAASGVYFARLTAGTARATHRLLLAR